ncbi:MAG: transcriptional repressor [candidate division Zixibacteria bacterium]|nr:transcriptional repressor [candidate division Zixibacteria bacterium]MDH3938439.1 transcriptional repressor [candidate division Zixibacteria bacterium]MDH4034752.1 transcriptional repressor [candidate division Zixibacteria bacterium]
MKDLLRTKGFKSTPQRELIFDCFLSAGRHITVDELYQKVRQQDPSVGHSTVWRNLKLICKLGLAEEVNIGDGITRYDRTTPEPHGHLFCMECKKLVEFDVGNVLNLLNGTTQESRFQPVGFKIEIQGYCSDCQKELGLSDQDSDEQRPSNDDNNVRGNVK